jgi:putative oxidoreductase
MNKDWWNGRPHHSEGSLNLIRFAVACILITHPVYASLHPDNIRGFGYILASHHVSFAAGAACAVMLVQTGCSLALVVGRLVVPACIGHICVLVAGIVLIHAPRWRTVGLPDGDHQPGSEFSVLLIACLFAILWAYRRKGGEESRVLGDSLRSSRQALELIRVASASILIIHPIGGLSDPAALNGLGHYFSSIGFPLGVAFAWGSMFLQIASSLALIARRLVVPACFAHILVLITGVWLFHAPFWFVIGPDNVVGPGREGMEYSTLLITCFAGLIFAYWPRRGEFAKGGAY